MGYWRRLIRKILRALRLGGRDLLFAHPIRPAVITSGWGRPRSNADGTARFHRGVDLAAEVGTKVRAAATGIAHRVDLVDNSNAGKHVVIRTRTSHGVVYHRYLHMGDIYVKKGSIVNQGDLIGTVGLTGVKRSRPHLHFDMQVDEAFRAYFENTFGQPEPKPSKSFFGWYVPSETFLPVDGLSTRSQSEAMRRNVIVLGAGGNKDVVAAVSAVFIVGLV